MHYPDETLEQTAKPWNALLGMFLGEMAVYELTIYIPGRRQSAKNSSLLPSLNVPMKRQSRTVAVYRDGYEVLPSKGIFAKMAVSVTKLGTYLLHGELLE